MRGAREAPAPRDSLNFRRASLLSRNEFESGTFTIVFHATSSFTYVSVIYGANFPFNEELFRIQNVMESNGYPMGFVKRTIKRQIKKKTGVKLPKEDEKAEKMVNASIPFIEGLSQEVRRIAQAAGVKCTFRTANTLRSVYSAKDRLPKDTQTHCIYSLKCGTCEDEYVGETLRAIGVRAKEHRDAVSTGDHKKSALAEHVLSHEKLHEINWRSLNAVDKATNMKEPKVREAFHIQKRKPGLNRDKGVEKSTPWDTILNT